MPVLKDTLADGIHRHPQVHSGAKETDLGADFRWEWREFRREAHE
jgi:hypothetical protein